MNKSFISVLMTTLLAGPALAETVAVAPQSVPALTVQFQCGDCAPAAEVEGQIRDAYTKAAVTAGYQVSGDASAALTITKYKARSKGLAAFGPIGLMAAQSKIEGNIVLGEANHAISESGFGADRAAEVVGEKVFLVLTGKTPAPEESPSGFGF